PAAATRNGKPAVSNHLGGIHPAHSDPRERGRVLRGAVRARRAVQPQDRLRRAFVDRVRAAARRPLRLRLARPHRGTLDAGRLSNAGACLRWQQVRPRSHPRARVMEDIPLWGEFATLTLLLSLAAFFSIAETAMMALNRYRLNHLVAQGHGGARRAADLLKRTDRLLGAILIGNTMVSAAA